ncbi:MAG: amylo-alpha-1,6-glucosidase [Burkholderiaceae bacterium]
MNATQVATTESEAESITEGTQLRLFVLKMGDTFLVADINGDVTGGADGLFRNDTRVLSNWRLRFADTQPSLLSAAVSHDDVFFTAHLTNHALPPLGNPATPEAVIHIERKRFLWEGTLYERIELVHYGAPALEVPLALEFGADFRDMFEVRGQQRTKRGERLPPHSDATGVELSYRGLDNVVRRCCIGFSETPRSLDEQQAEFFTLLKERTPWTLYVEIGPAPSHPDRQRFRRAAALAILATRKKLRQGARLCASARMFQSWLDKSRADVALLTTELATGPYPYAGIPWFSTPFGRDAIITALQTLWINPELALGVLSFLARNQAHDTSTFRDAEPGKIMHETRKGEMAAVDELPFGQYYGGVDTTPLFIMLAGAYAERTGDRAAIDRLWPALNGAAHWIERNADGHGSGFVSYARGEDSGLANQGWKDSEDSVFHADGLTPDGPISLIEVQGYAHRAWRVMAEMAEWRGEEEAAHHWSGRAESLRAAVEQHFWLPDLQFYALALDGGGNPCRVRASNAGQLLYTGLPDAERGRAVARQLLTGAFDSGWGLRTLPPEAARFNPMSYHNGSVWPHDSTLCVAGLARYGERDGVVRLTREMFEAANYFGMRLPELFCGFERAPGEAPISYPVACLPQAWAAGSVFMLLQACLGLTIDARRHLLAVERPRLPDSVDRLLIADLEVGPQRVDLGFQRLGARVVAFIERQTGPQPIALHIEV